MSLRFSSGIAVPVVKARAAVHLSVRRISTVRVSAIAEPTAKPHLKEWTPTSWRKCPIVQQPIYPDAEAAKKVNAEIARMPPLIFAGECRTLQQRLAKASTGGAFLITGGDCAESFEAFSANRLRDYYRVMLQMSVIMAFGGGVPVIKVWLR